MQIGPNTTFTQILQENNFQQGVFKSGDKFLRFDAGKGLYTSQKASTAKLTFWNRDRIQQRLDDRASKRADGAQTIKNAINREYGPGVADAIFNKIAARTGRDMNGGVTRADLTLISRELGTKASTASRDPDLAHVAGAGAGYDRTVGFYERHFEALSHPAFWNTQEARFNPDNMGSGLAFSVLERVTRNDTITPNDIRDLNTSLDPLNIPSGNIAQRLPATLAGAFDDNAKNAIAQQLYDVYGSATSDHMLNIAHPDRQALARVMTDPTATADDKLTALKTAFSTAISENGLHASNFTKPLSQVPI